MQRIKQNPIQFLLFVLIMMCIFSCGQKDEIVLHDCEITFTDDVIVHEPAPNQ